MWSKTNNKPEQKSVVRSTQTRYVTQTRQVVTRTVEHRTRAVSVVGTTFNNSRENSNYLPLPSSTLTQSSSNLPDRTSFDARPPNVAPINLNYASPYRTTNSGYRNSPAYSSYRQPSPVKNSSYRPVLPATVQPLPVGGKQKFKVTKTGRFHDSGCAVPTYATHSKNRGEVLIINNIMFEDKGYRHGAKVDHENLKSVFKQMGFKVTVELDLKKAKMESKIKDFSKKSSLHSADIAIVVVMSHGTKNETLGGTEVFGLDEKGLLVDDIVEYFNETNCKQMANKPKIFIFQCCRGDNELFIQSDAKRLPEQKTALTNGLIAYSTLPGFVSHRDPENGTWYVSALCEVFSQHAHEYHVEDLLKMVDVKLGSWSKSTKQTTHYENRGFKRCFLHPV